jgi:hypothetical protein
MNEEGQVSTEALREILEMPSPITKRTWPETKILYERACTELTALVADRAEIVRSTLEAAAKVAKDELAAGHCQHLYPHMKNIYKLIMELQPASILQQSEQRDKSELTLRRLLFLNHPLAPGKTVHSCYGDDGEMQCCMIDWKRCSAAFIDEFFAAAGMQRLAEGRQSERDAGIRAELDQLRRAFKELLKIQGESVKLSVEREAEAYRRCAAFAPFAANMNPPDIYEGAKVFLRWAEECEAVEAAARVKPVAPTEPLIEPDEAVGRNDCKCGFPHGSEDPHD